MSVELENGSAGAEDPPVKRATLPPVSWVDDPFLLRLLEDEGLWPVTPMEVPLADIDFAHHTQTRILSGRVSKQHVDDIATALCIQPHTCKRVFLFRPSGERTWRVGDGWHRTHACESLGLKSVGAYCCESAGVRDSQLQSLGVQANSGQMGVDREDRLTLASQRLMAGTVWLGTEVQTVNAASRNAIARAFRVTDGSLSLRYSAEMLRRDATDTYKLRMPSNCHLACARIWALRAGRPPLYLPMLRYFARKKPTQDQLTEVLKETRCMLDQDAIDYVTSLTVETVLQPRKVVSPGEKALGQMRRISAYLQTFQNRDALDLSREEMDEMRELTKQIQGWAKKVL